jgi:hypothetical protein
VEYLLDGLRVKLNFNGVGNITSLQNLKHDLQGRWVAFVGAENDKHLTATHPPAPKQEPMDLDLARAMCRGAGISLVSRDFIERFADFVSDWKKGDFTLPKYAELDMQSCFAAWQAFEPDLAAPKLVMLSDKDLDRIYIEADGNGFDFEGRLQRAFCTKNGLTLEASAIQGERHE